MNIRNSSVRTVAALCTLAVSLALVASGCNSTKHPIAPIPTDAQTLRSNSLPPVLRGTIGELARFIDDAPVRVEGYGLVGPLANTGSGSMDPRIREILVDQFVSKGIGLWSTQTQNIHPEEIVDSRQAAAVEVRGIIPPLAKKGSTFDLYINAVPNSEATSLANGLLLFSDLKRIGLTLQGNDSRTIALGRGPVFIPGPLDVAAKGSDFQPAADARRALRAGRVLAGGVVAEDSLARLQVYTPDAHTTRIIEHAINAKFPGRVKAAEAMDDSIVELHVPAEFAENPVRFVELVEHLYLDVEAPGFSETKAREIIDSLQQPGAPRRELSVALEGLGGSILPDFIQKNYTAADEEFRFWCARAGASLQDPEGMTVLQQMIHNSASGYRRQALQALIEASRGHDTESATLALLDMARSVNTEDRIMAYQALVSIHSRAITTYSVGKKFLMDLLPSDGPPLIYVMEANSARVAFIGRMPALPPGALYISRDRLLTVSADQTADASSDPVAGGAVLAAASVGGQSSPVNIDAPLSARKPKENVTLYWRPPLGDNPVRLRTLSGLPALVARVTAVPEDVDSKEPFIGASYQRVTEMLATMCADKVIDAQFAAQHVPDAIVSPTDQALSARPEGSTQNPATQPATGPAQDK